MWLTDSITCATNHGTISTSSIQIQHYKYFRFECIIYVTGFVCLCRDDSNEDEDNRSHINLVNNSEIHAEIVY